MRSLGALTSPDCPACGAALRVLEGYDVRYWHCTCDASTGKPPVDRRPHCDRCRGDMIPRLGERGPNRGRWYWYCYACKTGPPEPEQRQSLWADGW